MTNIDFAELGRTFVNDVARDVSRRDIETTLEVIASVARVLGGYEAHFSLVPEDGSEAPKPSLKDRIMIASLEGILENAHSLVKDIVRKDQLEAFTNTVYAGGSDIVKDASFMGTPILVSELQAAGHNALTKGWNIEETILMSTIEDTLGTNLDDMREDPFSAAFIEIQDPDQSDSLEFS